MSVDEIQPFYFYEETKVGHFKVRSLTFFPNKGPLTKTVTFETGEVCKPFTM